MTDQPSLQDVQTREEQLRLHILKSEDYAVHFRKEFNRQVFLVYLSIVLLLAFQTLFAWGFGEQLETKQLVLILVTSALAIANCFLLIHTRRWMRQINERWIAPEEKVALESLRVRRYEIAGQRESTDEDSFEI